MADILIEQSGIYKLSNQVYHTHPTPAPSLSAGIAKILLKKSPLHAWTAHPACPWHEPAAAKTSWDLGSAVHDVLLGGDNAIVEVHAEDWRTNAAKNARDAAHARGLIPILTPKLQIIRDVVEAARAQLAKHETDADACTGGKPELSLFWREANGIWCQCRPDWLRDDLTWCDDLKSTETSVNPDVIGRWAMDQGHDLVDAWYRRGLKAVTGKSVPVRFIAVEVDPPHAICVYTIPSIVSQMADEQIELAIRMWGRCLERGEWPAYPRRRIEIDVPPWAMALYEQRRERAKLEDGARFDPVLAELINEGFRPAPGESAARQTDDLDKLLTGEL